jgi:predicted metal-binding protein
MIMSRSLKKNPFFSHCGCPSEKKDKKSWSMETSKMYQYATLIGFISQGESPFKKEKKKS